MKEQTGGILLLFAGILQMGFAVLSALDDKRVQVQRRLSRLQLTALAMLGLLIIIEAHPIATDL